MLKASSDLSPPTSLTRSRHVALLAWLRASLAWPPEYGAVAAIFSGCFDARFRLAFAISGGQKILGKGGAEIITSIDKRYSFTPSRWGESEVRELSVTWRVGDDRALLS